MPWESIQDLLRGIPELKSWPEKYQRQFLRVANNCMREGGSESSCIAQAWAVINRRAEEESTGELEGEPKRQTPKAG